MSADEKNWPDKDRPGVPLEPEKSTAHELENVYGRFTAWWIANERVWILRGGGNLRAEGMRIARYHGPMRTVADLRAASAAAFKAGVEAAAEEMGALWVKWPRPCRDEAAAHLRALPIPDASALDTALERARRVADLESALDVALAMLTPMEPADSRAVSDEFVAMAAVACGVTDEPTRNILRDARAAIRARSSAGREGGG